jgi:hypothetical protein
MRMPPEGWSADKIALFERWVTEGVPKLRADRYCEFFRSIDAQTEYFDVYGAVDGREDLGPFYQRFFGPLLRTTWVEYLAVAPVTPILRKKRADLWAKVEVAVREPLVREGLLRIDEWLCSLVSSHFVSGGTIDLEALFDAFAAFGADILPPDNDRLARVQALNDPSDYRLVNDFALWHRMDSRSMWFFWFGHIQCTLLALQQSTTARDELRAALLAALFVGQTIDTSLRPGSNGLTRSAYKGIGGPQNILATAHALVGDPIMAVGEMEELYLMWVGVTTPT